MSRSRSSSTIQFQPRIVHTSLYRSTPDLGSHRHENDELIRKCPFNVKTCPGCDVTPEDVLNRISEASSGSSTTGVAPPYLRSVTLSSSIASFNSPATMRLQLREEFLRLYFPVGISDSDTDFMFTKFLCRDILETKGITSQFAIDALSLFNLGNAQNDHQLIHEAQRNYDAAVRGLDIQLADSGAEQDDGVLSSAYILSICENFHLLCPTTPPEQPHRLALLGLFRASGPHGKYSKYAQLLLYNFRHILANSGLVDHERVPLSGRHWKRSAAMTDATMAMLTEHLIALPNALEEADAAIENGRPNALYHSMLELANFERSMQAWLLRWYSSFYQLAYQQEDSEKYCHVRRHTKGTPSVFPKNLHFPSFSHASAQVAYWVALLQIKQSIYDVKQRLKLPIWPVVELNLVAGTNEIADKLCQSVAWLTQPQHGLCGVLRSHDALYHASRWYTERMHFEKIVWCQKVTKSLEKTYSLSCHTPAQMQRWSTRKLDTEHSGSRNRCAEDDVRSLSIASE